MLRIRKKKELCEPQEEIREEMGITIPERVESETEEIPVLTISEPVDEPEELPVKNPDETEEKSVFNEIFRAQAEAYGKGKGLETGQLDEALETLENIGNQLRNGEVTMETLDLVVRGLEFDRAVAAAEAAGELRGRNSQIEEKYMKPVESDGVPHLGSNGNGGRRADRIASIFDLARNA